MAESLQFRFDADSHTYIDTCTGEEFPHITGMLQRTGWVNPEWFTPTSAQRGTAVHKLTADFDLGALDVDACVSPYRGWLLAHVEAMSLIRPDVLHVEQPVVHPVYRFGGRPDRVVAIDGLIGILEIKSGQREKNHAVQTALQAILVSVETDIPAEALRRWALYLSEKGRFVLDVHRDRADFREAKKVIATCCNHAALRATC